MDIFKSRKYIIKINFISFFLIFNDAIRKFKITYAADFLLLLDRAGVEAGLRKERTEDQEKPES